MQTPGASVSLAENSIDVSASAAWIQDVQHLLRLSNGQHKGSTLTCAASGMCTINTQPNNPRDMELGLCKQQGKNKNQGATMTVKQHMEAADGCTSDGESRLCKCGAFFHRSACRRHHSLDGQCGSTKKRTVRHVDQLAAAYKVGHSMTHNKWMGLGEHGGCLTCVLMCMDTCAQISKSAYEKFRNVSVAYGAKRATDDVQAATHVAHGQVGACCHRDWFKQLTHTGGNPGCHCWCCRIIVL